MSEKYSIKKFVLNRDGVHELLFSDGVIDMINGIAEQKANGLGDGYVHLYSQNKFVPVAFVAPNTEQAEQDNYENNTLLKAVR